MQRGIVTLLPPARTPGVIAHLRADAPDLVLLVDREEDAEPRGGLPVHRVELVERGPATALAIPESPARSSSRACTRRARTGQPQPQPKLWASLVRNAAAQVQRLAEVAPEGIALLGTVPAQHSYGFESTVLVALAAGATLTASRPFFPADIAG